MLGPVRSLVIHPATPGNDYGGNLSPKGGRWPRFPDPGQLLSPRVAAPVGGRAPAAIEFYESVFGAAERMRIAMPDGTVAHAEIDIGGIVIMISDETPGSRDPSRRRSGRSPVALFAYVEDVDSVYEKALAAGVQVVQAP
jgi:uncharacterized glyoxalase superfamily protein PhnB